MKENEVKNVNLGGGGDGLLTCPPPPNTCPLLTLKRCMLAQGGTFIFKSVFSSVEIGDESSDLLDKHLKKREVKVVDKAITFFKTKFFYI